MSRSFCAAALLALASCSTDTATVLLVDLVVEPGVEANRLELEVWVDGRPRPGPQGGAFTTSSGRALASGDSISFRFPDEDGGKEVELSAKAFNGTEMLLEGLTPMAPIVLRGRATVRTTLRIGTGSVGVDGGADAGAGRDTPAASEAGQPVRDGALDGSDRDGQGPDTAGPGGAGGAGGVGGGGGTAPQDAARDALPDAPASPADAPRDAAPQDAARDAPPDAPAGGPGTPCNPMSQCAQGLTCVKSVCCESACLGLCMGCSGAETGAANGLCRPLRAGTPDSRCSEQPPSTCGTDGQCNGNGACRRYPDGVECGTVCCSDGANVCAATCRAGQCTGVSTKVTRSCADMIDCTEDGCAQGAGGPICTHKITCGATECCCAGVNGDFCTPARSCINCYQPQ